MKEVQSRIWSMLRSGGSCPRELQRIRKTAALNKNIKALNIAYPK